MTLTDTVYIEADPATVWAVTADVDRWPEWTPTVTSVRRLDGRPLGLGSRARIAQPGQPEAEWVVTDFVAGERFTWRTRRTGLVVEATHVVTPDGAGTRNVLRVEASGVMATALAPVLRPLIQRALAAENQGLKARCEGEETPS